MAATRPARERKEPERHIPTITDKEDDEFVVKQGPGEELGALENVAFRLQKTTTASDELKVFHRVCFGKPGNKNNMKKNLRKFSGFPEEAATERGKKAAEKMDTKMMKKVLELCDLEKSGTKAECVDRLVGFLKAPKSSGKKSLADKVATKRKRTEAKKEKATKKTKKTKTDGPKRPMTAFLLYCDAKRAKVREENPGASLGETAKILGEKWKGISDERRQKYLQQAADLKAKYEEEKAKAGGGKATKAAKKPSAKKSPTKSPAKSPAKKKKKEEDEEEADEEPEDEPEEEGEDEEPADDDEEEEEEAADGEDGDEDGKDEPEDDDDDE